MIWLPFDTWIVIIGALCAVACALPGCFLVLRKMSMMGDAISHAVLPGLAIGFLLTGSRSSLPMFIGAAVVGVLTAIFTQWISRFGRVDRGAAMGIVFTSLFALGLLLIVQASDQVDLDPGCVLYGAVELTPLDVIHTFHFVGSEIEVPRAAVSLGVVVLLNSLLILLLFKEFNLSSFDPSLATTVGINATVMHYLLMAMVAITTVASFEAVGSIIVIAMLVVPASAAYLLTDRLSVMLGLSAVIGILSAGLGHLGAITVPLWFGFESTTTSGMMACAAGFLFALIWVFSPRYGLLARKFRRKGKVENE
ncbi:metal ABC transporter permease [Pontiellaceae bacterium B1224]|nr:metal ABC transporter permease [Pontiellaceae bacterium B1224]